MCIWGRYLSVEFFLPVNPSSAVIIEVRYSVELCPIHALVGKDWVYLWNVMIYVIMETVGLCTVPEPV